MVKSTDFQSVDPGSIPGCASFLTRRNKMLKIIIDALIVFMLLVIGYYMGENACVIKHQKRNEELFDRIIDKLEKMMKDTDEKDRRLKRTEDYAGSLDVETIKSGGSEKRV